MRAQKNGGLKMDYKEPLKVINGKEKTEKAGENKYKAVIWMLNELLTKGIVDLTKYKGDKK